MSEVNTKRMLLSPRDYARGRRHWTGEIPLTSFTRLNQEFSDQKAKVEIDLSFYLDANERVRMEGIAKVKDKLICQQCLEALESQITAEIAVCLMSETEIAKEDLKKFDVLECDDGPIPVVDLIEDDLLLNIPWKVCQSAAECVSEYKDDDSQQANDTSDATTRPFADLKRLLDKH